MEFSVKVAAFNSISVKGWDCSFRSCQPWKNFISLSLESWRVLCWTKCSDILTEFELLESFTYILIYAVCVHNISYLWLRSRNDHPHQSDPELFVSLFYILLCCVSSSLLSFFLMPVCIIWLYPLIIDLLSISLAEDPRCLTLSLSRFFLSLISLLPFITAN